MHFVKVEIGGGIATIALNRGKVNAINQFSGAMYSAEKAMELGLVQAISNEDQLIDRARRIAADMASKPAPAFAGIKSLLRKPIADEMMRREGASIDAFVEIWYTEETWAHIQKIKIY